MEVKNPYLDREKVLIGAEWRSAESGRWLSVVNPATLEPLGRIPDMGSLETTDAVEQADRAWGAWKQVSAKERGRLLLNWRNLILDHRDTLAELITLEAGKPLAESKGEILYGTEFLQWFAEEARRIEGNIIESDLPNTNVLVYKEPVGVVGAITPWNFPVAMITRKVAPALAAGCTCIIKPSELTPFSAIALVELAQQAGFPAGVINLVTGGAVEIGKVLTKDSRVRKISFTGSTRVGRILARDSAEQIKKLSLELGGNAPFIVFPDANLESAVQGILKSKFRNSGQTCVCPNRFYFHQSIHDELVERLREEISALPVGNGLEPSTKVGPLINAAAVEKVRRHVDDALERGAELRCGGRPEKLGENFFQPTLLTEVPADALVNQEETFGPLVAAQKFRGEEELWGLVNSVEVGLASYVYTRDLSRAIRASRKIEAGIVGLNESAISQAPAPFGGIKQSGLGREGSRYGLEDYLEIKYVCLGGLSL